MKAVRFHAHGGPDVLRFEDAPDPIPGPGDALVLYSDGITEASLGNSDKGIDLIKQLKLLVPKLPILVLSRHKEVGLAVAQT